MSATSTATAPPSTMTATRPSKRTPVPLLLEAFPVPPTHIPLTPTTPLSANPPPTGPPTVPLPPVPGPSRISEHEQLLLLSSALNRSRRSSKYSTTSHRQSVASTTSDRSPATPLSALPPSSKRDSSASSPSAPTSPRSSVSAFSRPSISVSGPSPSAPRHAERDLHPQLTRITMSPIPLSDIEDEDQTLPDRMPSPTLPRTSSRHNRHQANESISEIDIRDVLGLTDPPQSPKYHPSVSTTSHHHNQLSLADPIDPTHHPLRPTHSPSSSTSSTTSTSMLHNSTSGHSSFGSFSYPSSSKKSPVTVLAPFAPAPPSHPLPPLPPTPSPYEYTHVSDSQQLNTSVSTITQLSDDSPRSFSPSNTIKDSRMERRAERTKSEGLRKALGNRSRSRSLVNAERKPEPAAALPALPVGLGIQVKKNEPSDLDGILVTKVVQAEVSKVEDLTIDDLATAIPPTRSPSPDIGTILSNSVSRKRSKSRTRRRRVASAASIGVKKANDGQSRLRFSEGSGARRVSGESSISRSSLKSTDSWDPKGMIYNTRSDDEHDDDLERVLEGEGSEDDLFGGGASDSSLDLHTPLPHLMVRHGLLSPNSKLLPGAASRATTPMVGVDGRPGSTMSIASNVSMMTKSGIIKDERDTPMRRVRHRDGRMLRGGIGLTTGLGWSDSEDEDAPSPLTRRLSSLNLSRRSSASSLVSRHPSSRPSSHQQYRHPLSRSYSSGALLESGNARAFDEVDGYDDDFDDPLEEEEDNALQESGEWAQRHRQRPRRVASASVAKTPRQNVPPTSWTNRSSSGGATDRHSRTSVSSLGSRSGPTGRSSTGSLVDHQLNGSTRIGQPTKKHSQDEVNTTPSSTASTLSIPMPPTPRDLDSDQTQTAVGKTIYDKEKSLPPLPAGGLRKLSSGSTSSVKVESTTGSASKIAFPRARTFSSTSTAAAAAASASSLGPTPPSPGVRPLQLPRLAAGARDRPAVPVPSILSSSASRTSLRTPTSSSFSPSSPAAWSEGTESVGLGSPPLSSPLSSSTGGVAKPKPRTGTGMVYRTSSNSKMRPPVSSYSSSRGAASTGGVVSNSTTTGSIGRTNGISRAIAL